MSWHDVMSGYAGNRRRLLSWRQRKYRSKKNRKRKLRTAPAKVFAFLFPDWLSKVACYAALAVIDKCECGRCLEDAAAAVMCNS